MRTIFAFGLAAVLLAAVPVRADILATGSRANNFSSDTTYTNVPVPLNGAYFSVSFTTTSPNQIIRVTYNAECGAVGNPGNWLSVTVLVDGIAAAPASGSSFAFCTATSTDTYSWVGATRQATIKVPNAGTHKVNVTGYGAGTTIWWLGDSSIVIDK